MAFGGAALLLAGCASDRAAETTTAPDPPASAASGGSSSTAGTTGGPVTPHGFERVAARVTAPDGEVCDLCVWLADTRASRAQGLMEVTDLGDAAAMAFVYPSPTTSAFWMKNTPLPLSIAFFDAGGTYLDAFDMDPCTTPTCPSYPTPTGFTVAVEVPRGGLTELLIGPGSTLELTELACPDRAR